MPAAWKARIALRTVCVEQPRPSAICEGDRPWALAFRICAPQGKCVGGPKAGSDGLPLRIAQGTDEGRWLHSADDARTMTLAQDHL